MRLTAWSEPTTHLGRFPRRLCSTTRLGSPARGGTDHRMMRIVHAIHDFLPRHRAGSELYAFELCRQLARRHLVTIVCAEFDPTRAHGSVTWRVHEGLPVVEIVNNWKCDGFADGYRSAAMNETLAHVLRATDPDVLHIHSLLNLSFDLPGLAR